MSLNNLRWCNIQLSEKQIAKIYKQVDLDNKQIVMLGAMGDKTISISEKLANIYCIDQEKNIIWQVSEIKTKPSRQNRWVSTYVI